MPPDRRQSREYLLGRRRKGRAFPLIVGGKPQLTCLDCCLQFPLSASPADFGKRRDKGFGSAFIEKRAVE